MKDDCVMLTCRSRLGEMFGNRMDASFNRYTLCSADFGKNWRKLNQKHPQLFWVYGLTTVGQMNPSLETLKQCTFSQCSIADVLILAAPALDLRLWSGHGVLRPPHTVSLCELATSLSPHLLLSFPPRLRRPRACTLEVGLLGGRGGRCLRGAALLCPHHWLLTKISGPVHWNSISANNRIIQYKS